MTQTPAIERVHRPVLLNEASQAVAHAHNGVFVDATFGRGGHSRKILSLISEDSRLYAFDRDPEAIEAAKAIQDPRFEIIDSPFSRMQSELDKRGVTAVSGILMDIGVSSPQIDDPARGFTFREDGPLDMRMDPNCGESAEAFLALASEGQIAKVIREYGEERYASRIAAAICRERQNARISRTRHLADLVASVVPVNRRDPGQNPATRTFQALRIYVNDELGELRAALNAAGRMLVAGGTLAVISFHSLEDRIVKNFFAAGVHPEKRVDARIVLPASFFAPPVWEEVKRIKSGKVECEENPRARSAVLRMGIRTNAPFAEVTA